LSAPGLGVIVNHHTWLLNTQNWIFTQLACLPASITPYVVCRQINDLEQFTTPNLFAFSELSWLARLRALARAAPILGTSLRGNTALIEHVTRRHGAQLVHSHFGYTGYYSARAVRKLGLKHVVTFYGVDMSALPAGDPRWLARYRRMFADVDQVLCEGRRMAEGVSRLGCPAEKLRVHHLGVRLHDLPFRPRVWRVGEPLKVLIAASFREKKGIPYALEALERLKARTNLQVTIIGDAGSNPKSLAEKARIHAIVAKCGLALNVRFMGYQPRSVLLAEAYLHHVFLSPSVTASDGDTEGGAPVAIIEMAATGMPVVSSRHADIPDVIEDRVGGLLADERDVEQLAACLRMLVDAPENWEAMGRAARQRIEREYDAESQGLALAGIYERVSRI
jgi:colanic acid/amylovoran biosynthesis glycosyltransferase